MNARKRNKTITLVIVAFVSIGLLLSVSLYWQNSSSIPTGAAPVSGSPEDIAVRDFSQGLTFMQQQNTAQAQKKFESAIKGFEEVIKKDPKNFQTLGDLATAYFYTGKVDKAIENVKKALEISPNFTTARLNYAIYLFYGKNDSKGALAEIKKIPKGDINYNQAQQLIKDFSKNNSAVPNNSKQNTTNSNTGSIQGNAQLNNSTGTNELPAGHPNINNNTQPAQQTEQNSGNLKDNFLPKNTKQSFHSGSNQ